MSEHPADQVVQAHRAAQAGPGDVADPGDVQAWAAEAISLAIANVAAGGGPFGAVVVRDGSVVATGTNQVTPLLDPTAHAEVVAIRNACQALGDFSLRGCVLVASCEPCPLCLAASLWARVQGDCIVGVSAC